MAILGCHPIIARVKFNVLYFSCLLAFLVCKFEGGYSVFLWKKGFWVFMVYDKKNADLFLQNFNEAYRSAKLLMLSYERVTGLMPIKGSLLNSLDMDDLDKLDAFRVRYCDLQDSLGSKTFRSILILEEEIPGSNLDMLNKIEKRGLIKTFEDWKILRQIRNLFSHDYPDSDEDKAEFLTIAYANTLNLVKVVDNVIQYMQEKLDFNMKSFPFLLKK